MTTLHRLFIIVLLAVVLQAEAKKSSRSRTVSGSGARRSSSASRPSGSGPRPGRPPVSKRRQVVEEEDEEMDNVEIDDEFDEALRFFVDSQFHVIAFQDFVICFYRFFSHPYVL